MNGRCAFPGKPPDVKPLLPERSALEALIQFACNGCELYVLTVDCTNFYFYMQKEQAAEVGAIVAEYCERFGLHEDLTFAPVKACDLTGDAVIERLKEVSAAKSDFDLLEMLADNLGGAR